MSKIGFSKADNRRVIMTFAVVAMFLATMGVSNVEATSPVSISTPDTTNGIRLLDIMEGGEVTTSLTISNSDSKYKKMKLYLDTNWISGDEWTTKFTDTNNDELANREVSLTKGGSVTVHFTVFCNADCNSGDEKTVKITVK